MAKKSKRKSESTFFIGLFVVVSTVLIMSVVIWLGTSKFFQEQTHYVTYFEGSVEGLESGSPVKYLGVPVGSISNVSVAPDGRLVEIIIQVDQKIDLNDSLRIKAEMAGIAGGKFLQLFYPDNYRDLYSSPDFKFDPPYQVIKSAPSEIQEITLALREVMTNLKELKVHEISQGTIEFIEASKVMMNATSEFFNDKELNSIITNLNNASIQIVDILQEADTSRILDKISRTGDNLLASSQRLNSFIGKTEQKLDSLNIKGYMDKVYNRYDTTMTTTENTINILGYRAESMLFTLSETLEELKVTNKQLQRSLRAISDNPSQIFLIEPPPDDE